MSAVPQSPEQWAEHEKRMLLLQRAGAATLRQQEQDGPTEAWPEIAAVLPKRRRAKAAEAAPAAGITFHLKPGQSLTVQLPNGQIAVVSEGGVSLDGTSVSVGGL